MAFNVFANHYLRVSIVVVYLCVYCLCLYCGCVFVLCICLCIFFPADDTTEPASAVADTTVAPTDATATAAAAGKPPPLYHRSLLVSKSEYRIEKQKSSMLLSTFEKKNQK